MIIKGNQRGGARQLALHLLNTRDNEHVEVHEVSGFMSRNLVDAMHETYAISKGTQCKQFIFSASLNPPQHEDVPVQSFIDAIEHIEQDLKLAGQPRAVVFHEKEGRRHCHVVWSRIDVEAMKAINLPFYHRKLMSISREQFLRHGWHMPRGLAKKQAHDPTNCTLAEWQQARRTGRNAREVKDMLQDAWAISDNKASFIQALHERGFWLARGDRRGYVVLDHQGEVYSIPKSLNLKTKAVQQRLGLASELQTLQEVKVTIAREMTPHLKRHLTEAKEGYKARTQRLSDRFTDMKAAQKQERQNLIAQQKERWRQETARRQARFAMGLPGLWDRVTGKHSQTRKTNEAEVDAAQARDEAERHELRKAQMAERRKLQTLFLTMRERQRILLREIHTDIAQHIEATKQQNAAHQNHDARQEAEPRRRRRRQRHEHDHDMER